MEAPIDTITVRATASADVQADKADLVVTIRGASLLTGNAAINKAREIRQLAADLATVGIGEAAITLLAVRAETATSVIGKASSASYDLQIRCSKLDTLAEVLGVITAQKNTQLTSIAWDYPDLTPIHDSLLAASLARAAAKAQIMATALASQRANVHAVKELGNDYDSPVLPKPMPMAAEMSRARMSSDDFGLALTHAKRITVQVEVVYHIQPSSESHSRQQAA